MAQSKEPEASLSEVDDLAVQHLIRDERGLHKIYLVFREARRFFGIATGALTPAALPGFIFSGSFAHWVQEFRENAGKPSDPCWAEVARRSGTTAFSSTGPCGWVTLASGWRRLGFSLSDALPSSRASASEKEIPFSQYSEK